MSKDFNPSIFFTKLTPGQSIFVYDINFAEILPEPECIFNSVQIANRTKLLQVSVFLCRKLPGVHCIFSSAKMQIQYVLYSRTELQVSVFLSRKLSGLHCSFNSLQVANIKQSCKRFHVNKVLFANYILNSV